MLRLSVRANPRIQIRRHRFDQEFHGPRLFGAAIRRQPAPISTQASAAAASRILARSSPHHFAHHRRMPRPCSGRQIICAAVIRLVRQHRKRERLFRFRRNAEFAGRHNLNSRQSRRQLRHHQRILRPASGHDQFIHPRPRQNKSAQRIRNRKRSEHRRRRTRSSVALGASCPRPEFLRVRPPELLAPRRLWRPLAQVWLPHHLLQQRGNHFPADAIRASRS